MQVASPSPLPSYIAQASQSFALETAEPIDVESDLEAKDTSVAAVAAREPRRRTLAENMQCQEASTAEALKQAKASAVGNAEDKPCEKEFPKREESGKEAKRGHIPRPARLTCLLRISSGRTCSTAILYAELVAMLTWRRLNSLRWECSVLASAWVGFEAVFEVHDLTRDVLEAEHGTSALGDGCNLGCDKGLTGQ